MSYIFNNIKKRFGNLLKQNPHKRIDNLNNSVKSSFNNLRKDMEHVSKLLHHYDNSLANHDRQFEMLAKRLMAMEEMLHELKEVAPKSVQEEIEELEEEYQQEQEYPIKQGPLIEDTLWESLTETQQRLCWKMAALQKEMPDQWISLKYLAQELYPDKDYNIVRSTLSQFIAGLEELGIVKRKRKGKQAYVFSTNKNPCNKKKMPVAIKQVEKKKVKKKEE
ncbi:MAG: hypothetical protein KKA65_01430 [Nanoarchaeota archaeon]|nr:hypothetical protein [Nanoarchaeota archaeon]MBU4241674.1 hypothetical protein [Nanoarchaeota archaeon]MBU4352146.1 hypothetical protein [Nanoarchaeota archaeon]MBU4456138.1 hypothetical protein [Nanoarchaeota archaeon]MCG2719136.1 hypothetical protein [Nanoarchaeota archaeon]